MATVTPNFNWPVPTSTDLVRDGATAIEALGDSIDGSLVDLKGGTTGQVLSKTSGTDMDFTWVTTDDANAIQNSIVDAKGDLIAATANDTPARLAVGNNGETLVADSSASTGLRYQSNFAAGKNKIINGAFDVWQRGTSVTVASAYGYGADRWRTYSYGSSTSTISQQTFAAGTAPVAGYEGTYFLRVNSTTGNTFLSQPIENVRTFAGQTVAISFWAKVGSAVSTASLAFDQTFGSGGSATVNTLIASSQSFTTSWVRYTYSIAVPSISGKTIGTNSFLDFNITLGTTNNNLDVWGVQIEAANTATAFQTATGTLQGELAACQRYYVRWQVPVANFCDLLLGQTYTTSQAFFLGSMPVTMRTSPTGARSGLCVITNNLGVRNTGGTYSVLAVSTSNFTVVYTHGSATFTAGQVSQLQINNSTSDFLELTAEL